MHQILFVDDDANILSALRRRLRSARPDWDLHFAASGAEALSLAKDRNFDVIVSDIQMPEMDGITLLEKLQDTHPDAVRIILTGHADNASYLRTIGPAHQFLSKPCDNESLIESIENALGLRQLLQSPELRTLVAESKSLASPPDTYIRLESAFSNPDYSLESISKIVESDIALTTEVLKLTNSSYFAVTQNVASVSHAVRMLGMETLKALALFVGLYRGFDGPPGQAANLKRLCHRSQQIGVTAALIAEYEKLPREICHAVPSIGMLSHIGTLILYTNRANEMDAVTKRVEAEGISIDQAETEQFGAGHAEIGAYLLGLWGFPAPVVQAVAYHHRPMDLPHKEMNALTSIYVAQHLAREIADQDKGRAVENLIDMDYLSLIGKADRLEEWKNIARIVSLKYSELTNN
ncbi:MULTISPECIES: response regulator [Thalassospira]|uniref:Response regulator n=1 Tax=Thalassospira profundimaris TaxID=502049 RepID=A0A367X720_9PROT|nr:response regulator [Thalassospira profundimaris]RCK49478.1 response regulator [Thalassospira profundimaris]